MEDNQNKNTIGHKMGHVLFVTTTVCVIALLIGLTAKLLIMMFS